jgi:hypothetical protein
LLSNPVLLIADLRNYQDFGGVTSVVSLLLAYNEGSNSSTQGVGPHEALQI